MKDRFGYRINNGQAQERVCRVAYTLNNMQPVMSTIIGEQPFFYMDDDAAYEDEALYADLENLHMLERALFKVKEDLESFERFSTENESDAENILAQFSENKGTAEQNIDLEALRDGLRHSRLAAAYLDFADHHNVAFSLDSQIRDGLYERERGKILLNPTLDFADQLLVATRELRRHWQHRQGALIDPLMFHPDHAVLLNRVQQADLAVSMSRVAWELQLSGNQDIWARLERSSMADLARSFGREAFSDFRTMHNGQASMAVFEGWFMSQRCRLADKDLIKRMLADHQGYVFDLKNEGVAKMLSPAMISAFGEMPYGKNYLAGHISTIMNDQLFNEVRDRSNANFLWFIKFECSFREAEQELQAGDDLSAGETLHAQQQTQDAGNEHSQKAGSDIINFPSPRSEGERGYAACETALAAAGENNIVAFPRASE